MLEGKLLPQSLPSISAQLTQIVDEKLSCTLASALQAMLLMPLFPQAVSELRHRSPGPVCGLFHLPPQSNLIMGQVACSGLGSVSILLVWLNRTQKHQGCGTAASTLFEEGRSF